MPSVTLEDGPGFCNAVRRAIISTTPAWAPSEVVIRVNTSCQTDEYLAHRIGLLVFRRIGSGTTMTLAKKGPCVARASDVIGCDFEMVHPQTEIATLGNGDELDMTIHLIEADGRRHARYSPCAAVGMKMLDGSGRHRITFELNDPERNPTQIVHAALDSLAKCTDEALRQLANQPETFPRTRC